MPPTSREALVGGILLFGVSSVGLSRIRAARAGALLRGASRCPPSTQSGPSVRSSTFSRRRERMTRCDHPLGGGHARRRACITVACVTFKEPGHLILDGYFRELEYAAIACHRFALHAAVPAAFDDTRLLDQAGYVPRVCPGRDLPVALSIGVSGRVRRQGQFVREMHLSANGIHHRTEESVAAAY